MSRAPMTPLAGIRRLPPPRDDESGVEGPATVFGVDPMGSAPIGVILVEAKRLAATDINRILDAARRDKLKFGEAALRLKLVRREDVEFALTRQFGAVELDPDKSAIAQEVIAAYFPNHPTVERLRGLRAEIEARATEEPNTRTTVAVVSPDRGDGRSFITANLAVLFAQFGRSTLLLDASLRTARLHLLFDLNNRTGLSTILARRSDLSCIQSVADVPGLQVLPAGPLPPNPLQLLEKPRFEKLLHELAKSFEVVLIDTPAGSAGGDAAVLSKRAGSALIVARANRTRQAQARCFALKLEQARTRVLGVVFNESH